MSKRDFTPLVTKVIAEQRRNKEIYDNKIHLIDQFTPQIGDYVLVRNNEDINDLNHYLIVGIDLGGYFISTENGIVHHNPGLESDGDEMTNVLLFRIVDFERYVLKTESDRTFYMFCKLIDNKCIYEVFDETFSFLRSVDVSDINTGLMDEIAKVLDTENERFKAWIRVFRNVLTLDFEG